MSHPHDILPEELGPEDFAHLLVGPFATDEQTARRIRAETMNHRARIERLRHALEDGAVIGPETIRDLIQTTLDLCASRPMGIGGL